MDNTTTLPAADFRAAIERVRPFASIGDERFYLNGAAFLYAKGGLNCYGTDGHQLFRDLIPATCTAPEDDGKLAFNVPSKQMAKIVEKMSGWGGDIVLTKTKPNTTAERIVVKGEGRHSLFWKHDGYSPPGYERVIRLCDDATNIITITDRESFADLIGQMKREHIEMHGESCAAYINIAMDGDNLKLTSRKAAEAGRLVAKDKDGRPTISVVAATRAAKGDARLMRDGDNLLGLDMIYLWNFARKMSGKTLELHAPDANANAPIKITSAGDSAVGVLMPVRL